MRDDESAAAKPTQNFRGDDRLAGARRQRDEAACLTATARCDNVLDCLALILAKGWRNK
jgi:hypothetical protein